MSEKTELELAKQTLQYSDGRVAYLDSTTRTVVIRNPSKGESTAFRPDYGIGWDNYIKRLPIQNTPLKN